MDWKSIIKTVAPTLATAFGTPVAGLAVKALAEGLLGDKDATEDQVKAAIISADPEIMKQIKEIDYKFKTDMQALDIDLAKIQADDRKDARQLFDKNQWPQIVLTAIFIIGYFVIIWIIVWFAPQLGEMKGWLQGIFSTVLGVLTGAIPQINSFWFGSSKGSQDKNKLKT